MVNITYVEDSGEEHKVDVEEGISLMEGAVSNSIPGIDADCGGGCACATCMILVNAEWQKKLNTMEEEEESMLDFHEYRTEESRLACQIPITQELDGIVVKMPPSQQ